MALAGAVALSFTVAPTDAARAEAAPSLSLPIDCEPGGTCWIWAYFDADPGPGHADYRCGRRTYNGHNGTDFAIGGLEDMARGLAVLAAAPGRVLGARDGQKDGALIAGGRAAIKGRECGNGVRIDHGNGWWTLYCHLRRGSVRVRPGDRVKRGQVLGMVGLSGLTQVPHLHFGVLYRKRRIDPFRGLQGGARCGPGRAPLWTKAALAAIRYRPVVIHASGFSTSRITRAQYREGVFPRVLISRRVAMIGFWADILALAVGDRVRFSITGLGGKPVKARDYVIKVGKPITFRGIGWRRRNAPWPTGFYTGRVSVTRGGKVMARHELDITVE